MKQITYSNACSIVHSFTWVRRICLLDGQRRSDEICYYVAITSLMALSLIISIEILITLHHIKIEGKMIHFD